MLDTADAVVCQLLLFITLLTPLEILLPARRTQRLLRRGLTTDLLYFALQPLLVGAAVTALLALFAFAIDRLLPMGFLALIRAQPKSLEFAEIFLFAEFSGYWIHRASHAVPWLWRLHAVHHSSRELDWMAAHRQHPLEAILHLAASNLPIVLLGFSLESLALVVLAQKVYTALLHANVKLGYGRLSRIVASPQFHHWHHDGAATQVVNFASTLPLFDVLFGTFALPDSDRLPSRYGIDETIAPSFIGQLVEPLRPKAPPTEISAQT